MVSERKARIYCCEDFSLIENYEKANRDLLEVWDLHHRKEEEGYSVKELIDLGLYYKRPACELIFLTHSEHSSLHKKGEMHPMFGKRLSVKTKRKMSFARKGEKNPMYGKSGEKSPKSKPVLQINKTTGEIIKIWSCMSEVERQIGIAYCSISQCCSGKRKSAGGFFWRYEQ